MIEKIMLKTCNPRPKDQEGRLSEEDPGKQIKKKVEESSPRPKA